MIHAGDVGITFTATIKDGGAVVDLTGVLSTTFIFNPPGGAAISKAASLVTDGSDGMINYTSESGLFTVPGSWTLQTKVVFASPARTFYTDLKSFEVGPQSA